MRRTVRISILVLVVFVAGLCGVVQADQWVYLDPYFPPPEMEEPVFRDLKWGHVFDPGETYSVAVRSNLDKSAIDFLLEFFEHRDPAVFRDKNMNWSVRQRYDENLKLGNIELIKIHYMTLRGMLAGIRVYTTQTSELFDAMYAKYGDPWKIPGMFWVDEDDPRRNWTPDTYYDFVWETEHTVILSGKIVTQYRDPDTGELSIGAVGIMELRSRYMWEQYREWMDYVLYYEERRDAMENADSW